jgi:uncharacterized protein (TIGR02001 family)
MKKLSVVVLASVAAFALPITTSIAAESSAYAALTSNYVFRGQTQTNDSAALQGGYDIKQSKADTGWYAGTFVSNVTSGIEIDLYGGWKGAFGKQKNMGYDVGAILYKYTDNNFAKDTTEFYGGINYETAYAKLFLGSGAANTTYLDLGASFVVLKDLDLDVHFGTYLTSPSSNDLSASLSMDAKGFDLSLGLTYEDAGAKNDIEFFVTITKEFNL